MKHFLRDNGLTLAMMTLFVASFIGHSISGFVSHNHDRAAHQMKRLSFVEYVRSAHLAESVFENWESEFLQMASYVVLTSMLYQRGSAESRPLPDEPGADEEESEELSVSQHSWLYRHSLSLALLSLFFISWILHGISGAMVQNQDSILHGESPQSVADFFVSSQFWFESLQNWQSEYLSVAVLIVFSIFLRETGSPESKSLSDPHRKTGK